MVRIADPEIAGRRLLVLGAGLWQVEYIRRARQLGVETWATDWSPNAVGRDEADHFAPIDLRDVQGTIDLARRARVDGVLTAADIGVPTAAAVAAALGLPGLSPELAEQSTNKHRMRQRAHEIGILCPWFERVISPADALARITADRFPVIVKPVDNCSSRGVRYVDTRDELAAAVEGALAASNRREALVEQFVSGTEGSIEALVQDGRVTVLGFCDKSKSPLPARFDLELRYPGAYDATVQATLHAFVERLSAGFGMRNGILHVEFVVDSNRRVYLIEFATRGCGSKVITHLMPVLTGVDPVAVLIRQALGRATPVQASRGRHGALHFLMFPPGRVSAVRGIDAARDLPGVIDACIEPAAGEVIGEVHDGRSRPGHVLVWGETRADVQAVLGEVRALVRLDYDNQADVAPLPVTV